MSQKIQTFRVEENLAALIPIGNLWSPDLQTWLSRSTIPMDFTCRIKRGKNNWFTDMTNMSFKKYCISAFFIFSVADLKVARCNFAILYFCKLFKIKRVNDIARILCIFNKALAENLTFLFFRWLLCCFHQWKIDFTEDIGSRKFIKWPQHPSCLTVLSVGIWTS